MSKWKLFDDPGTRLIAAQIALAVILILAPSLVVWFGQGLSEFDRAVQQEAHYYCTEQGCRPKEADDIVAYATLWLATWTALLVLVTTALFAATFALWLTTISAIRHGKEDAERARKQSLELFAVERRPWVHGSVQLDGDAFEENGNMIVPIAFRFMNIGLTPAVNATVVVHTTRKQSDGVGLDEFVKEMAFWRRHKLAAMVGGTLFPQEWLLDRHKLNDLGISATDTDNLSQRFFIRAWVQYKFGGGDDKTHYTPIVAWLNIDRDESGAISKIEIGPTGVPLPPD
jgi:hypothetical protein